ncbi:MAG: metallophosphoesterase family protein [Candidatus Dadabacteria bacterium]|nr:metallophosphoesterase family protein [Candidatus Dadabacteria bacterium]
MKILIMSDIHANWHATEAILARESYDALIFLGDVVDFGPDPRKCIDFLMESARMRFRGVRGEHDHAMAFGTGASPGGEMERISSVSREWGEGLLSSGEVGFLRRLPLEERISLDGMDFELAHRPDPETIPILERGRERTDPVSCRKFILVGHSHKPYIKSFGDTAVLNPGSVGQPRDNDPRASYAVIEDGEASIRRVKYDIEKTVKGLERSRMPYEVKGRLISMLLSGAAAG